MRHKKSIPYGAKRRKFNRGMEMNTGTHKPKYMKKRARRLAKKEIFRDLLE